MVKTNRSFKGTLMTIEFEIDVGKNPSITSSKDLEECFKQLIGFTAARMRPGIIRQALVKACKRWKWNIKCERIIK